MENPTLCRICGENCGILVTDDGRKLRITGNPLHPISNGLTIFERTVSE